MAIMQLKNLIKEYGAVKAVEDVSLDIEDGEMLTVLGPSGSGKTTILMMIAGLVHPTRGEIIVRERNVTHVPASRRNFGLVFQSYALFPHLTVGENVAFPLDVRGASKTEIRSRVATALDRVQLGGFADRKPSQLSGGQQQRVALARAFVYEPDILLLDEPLGALDRKLREQLQIELRALQRSLGVTTILVTHDQEEALSLSDRVVVMDDGKIQQIGAPMEVYSRPNNRFVGEFLGIGNFIEGVVARENGDDYLVAPEGRKFLCDARDIPNGSSVTALVRPEQIQINPQYSQDNIIEDLVVDELIYLGQSVKYILRNNNNKKFTVMGSNYSEIYEIGRLVNIGWDRKDIWLIRS